MDLGIVPLRLTIKHKGYRKMCNHNEAHRIFPEEALRYPMVAWGRLLSINCSA